MCDANEKSKIVSMILIQTRLGREQYSVIPPTGAESSSKDAGNEGDQSIGGDDGQPSFDQDAEISYGYDPRLGVPTDSVAWYEIGRNSLKLRC